MKKGTSIMEKDFSVTEKVKSTPDLGTLFTSLTPLVTEKGTSVMSLGTSVTKEIRPVTKNGRLVTDLIKSAMDGQRKFTNDTASVTDLVSNFIPTRVCDRNPPVIGLTSGGIGGCLAVAVVVGAKAGFLVHAGRNDYRLK